MYLGNLDFGTKAFNPRRLTPDEWDSYPSDWTRDSKAILFYFRSEVAGPPFSSRELTGRPRKSCSLVRRAIDDPHSAQSATGCCTQRQRPADPLDPSKRLMGTQVEGFTRSVLLTGDYSYHCATMPSTRCVLGEVKGQQLVFSVLDPVDGKGAEIQRVALRSAAYWSLSPDGTKIAIAYPGVICGRGTDSNLSRSQNRDFSAPELEWCKIVQSVAWSADGSHLFATAFTGTSFVILFIDMRGNLQVLTRSASRRGVAMLSRSFTRRSLPRLHEEDLREQRDDARTLLANFRLSNGATPRRQHQNL